MSDIFEGWTRLWPLIRTFITDEPQPNKRAKAV